MQASLDYSACTFATVLNTFQSLCIYSFAFKSSFSISVKVLFTEFTCDVYCAQQERVAVSYLCQVSRVTVLYYQSMFIAVFTFTVLLSLSWEVCGICMVLPARLDLQDLLSPAAVCRGQFCHEPFGD